MLFFDNGLVNATIVRTKLFGHLLQSDMQVWPPNEKMNFLLTDENIKVSFLQHTQQKKPNHLY